MAHTLSTNAGSPPQYPVGPEPGPYAEDVTLEAIAPAMAVLRGGGASLRKAVAGLTAAQIDTRYKNWTIRQIAHHLGDSHMNVFVRWKLALTEDEPTIKPYSEGAWSELAVSKTGDIETSVALVDAVHASWMALADTLTIADMRRRFHHPERDERVRLVDTVRTYAWHIDHHVGQVLWMRKAHGWG